MQQMTVKITENARQLVFMQESIGCNHAVGNETGKSGIDRGDRYGFCRKEKKRLKPTDRNRRLFFACLLHFSRSGRGLYFLAFSAFECDSRYSLPTLLPVQYGTCHQDMQAAIATKKQHYWNAFKNAHRKDGTFSANKHLSKGNFRFTMGTKLLSNC